MTEKPNTKHHRLRNARRARLRVHDKTTVEGLGSCERIARDDDLIVAFHGSRS